MSRKDKKEIEKRMLIKKTINSMTKQINVLEEQKKVFVEKAKQAKLHGLTAQVNLALTGYKMTLAQQKRAQEMLLNFEITAQMKDMTMMTKEFLGGMSILSKQMANIAKEKEFLKVQEQFETAMQAAETQSEQIGLFMETSKESFAAASGEAGTVNMEEVEKLVENQGAIEISDADIDSEIERVRKEIESAMK